MQVIILFALITSALAALNGPCNAGTTPGICISTAGCASGGGTSHTGFCPNDPTDVKCCTKPACGDGGNCRLTSACTSGRTAIGLCPGPSDFRCCLPAISSGNCTPPPVNEATLNAIKSFEGFVSKPAPDPIGLPTVGYGHLCKRVGCVEVPYAFPLSQSTATSLLQSDLRDFTKCIFDAVQDTITLNDNQYGALVSWAFNVGCGAAKGSTLIARLNKGEDPNTVAAAELPKFNKAGGNVMPGLTMRRAAEVARFQTASSTIAHPC